MKPINFFKFLEDKKDIKIPKKVLLADPDYTFDLNDFADKRGDVDLRNTQVQQLPPNLTVIGDLDLGETPLKELPENLTVGGDLDISGTSIRMFPDSLEVVEGVYAQNCPLTSIGNLTNIFGTLNLNQTPIESLPDGLYVQKNLWLKNCPNLKTLPNGLRVRDQVLAQNSGITTIPANLVVGNISLYECPLESIPEGFNTVGSADFSYTLVTKVPKNVKVGGTLSLNGSQVTEISPDLVVEGNLYVEDTPLDDRYTAVQIKQMLPGVKGNVYSF